MTLEVSLAHAFDAFRLECSFDAPAGVTALFGPSGAGKTTIAAAVAGLLRPDQGRITLNGRILIDTDARVHVPARHRGIGYVFQESRLFPHLSVLSNLRYGGRHEEAAIIDLLGLGGLLDRRTDALSGGEARRVAIGRALMSNPALLIMDEPLSGLDARRKSEILPYLERLRDRSGVPVLYVSHEISEIARLAQTLVVLQSGKVVRAGEATALLGDPAVARQLGAEVAGAVLTATVEEHQTDEGVTRLVTSAGPFYLPGTVGEVGARLRLRIPASDVILARAHPGAVSALNVFEATVTAIEEGRGPGLMVGLRAGDDAIVARITRKSAGRLDLAEGQTLFAMVKANAIAAQDVSDPMGTALAQDGGAA